MPLASFPVLAPGALMNILVLKAPLCWATSSGAENQTMPHAEGLWAWLPSTCLQTKLSSLACTLSCTGFCQAWASCRCAAGEQLPGLPAPAAQQTEQHAQPAWCADAVAVLALQEGEEGQDEACTPCRGNTCCCGCTSWCTPWGACCSCSRGQCRRGWPNDQVSLHAQGIRVALVFDCVVLYAAQRTVCLLLSFSGNLRSSRFQSQHLRDS